MFMLMMSMLMDKSFCTVDHALTCNTPMPDTSPLRFHHPNQSAVSRTTASTACRMLQDSVSSTMLSTEISVEHNAFY